MDLNLEFLGGRGQWPSSLLVPRRTAVDAATVESGHWQSTRYTDRRLAQTPPNLILSCEDSS